MDLSPLDRFTKRVEEWRYERLGNACNQISKAVQLHLQGEIEGYEDARVARTGLGGTQNQMVITYEISAKDLWYREFGTGFVGKSTFHNWEYLPTYPLTFFSRGTVQSTAGYTHAYHPETQRLGGWWYLNELGKYTFTEGEPAEMLLTNAINRMKFNGVPGLAEYVKMYL